MADLDSFREDIRSRLVANAPKSLVGGGLSRDETMFGNEEQEKEHLPKVCRGEIRWCHGYSEPRAGSDLAGLQTRACVGDS